MSLTKLSISTLLCSLALVGLGGCDDIINAVKNGADAAAGAADSAAGAVDGAGMSEDDKLGAKLNGYIHCINNVSSRVMDSRDRYADWVDIEKGLTGAETSVYGIYEVNLDEKCVTGVKESNDLEPDEPELEKAGDAYVKAYQAIQPVLAEAYKYYQEEDYKDDKFAKGKEFHPKLIEGWNAFSEADQALRELVSKHNEGLQVRELERLEKEEGRKLRFQNANIMAEAKKLVAVGDVPDAEFDLDKFTKALDAYTAAVEEAEKYAAANKAEADSVSFGSWFVPGANELKMSAKELMRRRRDKVEFSTGEKMTLESRPESVEGTSAHLIKAYNDLISDSNGINWTWYKPNGV